MLPPITEHVLIHVRSLDKIYGTRRGGGGENNMHPLIWGGEGGHKRKRCRYCGIRLWSYECGVDLELILWHPVAKVLFAGLESGDVYMLKVGTDELKCYSGGLGDAVSTIKLTESGLG